MSVVHISTSCQNRFYSVCGSTNIFLTEAYCVITQIIPSVIKWNYHTRYKQDILSMDLKTTVDRTDHFATLYLHQTNHPPISPSTKAILFLHGDHSHPSTLLPLIEIAEKRNDLCIFSLQMPFDVTHSESSQLLVHLAIDKVENLVKSQGGKLHSLVMAGHSKGGTQSAFEGFVYQDRRVSGVIAIAGRVQCVNGDTSCDGKLRPVIDQIQQAIEGRPDFPIYQIVPKDDWNAPISAMAIRPNVYCAIVEKAMHLNVLYKEQTYKAFKVYLRESFA